MHSCVRARPGHGTHTAAADQDKFSQPSSATNKPVIASLGERRTGKQQNEIYVDLLERLTVIFNSSVRPPARALRAACELAARSQCAAWPASRFRLRGACMRMCGRARLPGNVRTAPCPRRVSC